MCIKETSNFNIGSSPSEETSYQRSVFLSTPWNSFINNLKSQATNSISKAYNKAISCSVAIHKHFK